MAVVRKHVGQRMSQLVINKGVAYLAGQCAEGATVADQTRAVLAVIDSLLAEAGTDKSKLLSANVWVANISDFAEMNSVWDAWVSPGNPPARACVEARLATPRFLVEIMVTAAIE
jgi:enamine deaminase RidA (YjgF/YER057c/UK114 family)